MDNTFFAIGTVTGQDPDHGGVLVALRSGQMTPLPVRMLYQGCADAMRVNQAPLPVRGTAGLIIFPNGDMRSATWMGAYYHNEQDAITSDQGDPTVDYMAHWSGFWRLLDMNGTLAQQWPDGSYLVVGSGMTLPKVFRHNVDDQGQRQRIEYTMADRVSGTINPFSVFWQQAASGLTFALDASGHTSFTGGPSGSFTLAYGSGSTFVFDASGNMAINGKPGTTITLSFGNGTIKLDASGNIGLNVPASANVNLTQGGSAGDGVPLLSLLVQWLVGHTHTSASAGNPTSVPIQPLTAAQVQSAILKLQS